MQYRVWLMHAYFRVGRSDDLLTLRGQTDEYFHQQGRWQESAIAALAASCLENQLFERSVAYYEEVIALHQRTQPGRGIGGGTLSAYYGQLSRAYTGLEKTPEAVDAACGAVVSWGPRDDQRAEALRSLENVLHNAADLDRYVARLDREVAETGLQNPLVRKALGKVLLDKGRYAAAIEQLQLACEVRPNDTQTHQQLVACYDRLGDQQGAVERLLQSVALARRSIELYEDLGQRYAKLGQAEQAERAYTSIVEALPNESEGHALLAEIRQQQDRWDEAVEHWQQVARIRQLEPTGLVKLAEAQIHLHRWSAARQTIDRLRARSWPDRFGDVNHQARDLERRIDRGEKP
jgi:tetratricopeptide (TPR) repeat protein